MESRQTCVLFPSDEIDSNLIISFPPVSLKSGNFRFSPEFPQFYFRSSIEEMFYTGYSELYLF